MPGVRVQVIRHHIVPDCRLMGAGSILFDHRRPCLPLHQPIKARNRPTHKLFDCPWPPGVNLAQLRHEASAGADFHSGVLRRQGHEGRSQTATRVLRLFFVRLEDFSNRRSLWFLPADIAEVPCIPEFRDRSAQRAEVHACRRGESIFQYSVQGGPLCTWPML